MLGAAYDGATRGWAPTNWFDTTLGRELPMTVHAQPPDHPFLRRWVMARARRAQP